MKKQYIQFWLIWLFLLILAAHAQAQTWYVSAAGSDSNTCTQAQNISTPKLTIKNAAINCVGIGFGAGAGKTIIVRNGTYTENLDENGGNDWLPSGTGWGPSQVFTLKAENRATAQAAGSSANKATISRSAAILMRFLGQGTTGRDWYAVIDGFLFDQQRWESGTQGGYVLAYTGPNSGVNSVRIQYNEFINTGNANVIEGGITSDNSIVIGYRMEILYNKIHGGKFAYGSLPYASGNVLTANCCGYGIYILGSYDGIIRGNEFYDIPSFAIHMNDGYDGSLGRWTIDQNYFHNYGWGSAEAANYTATTLDGPAIIYYQTGCSGPGAAGGGQCPSAQRVPLGTVTNNVFSTGAMGITTTWNVSGQELVISNNTFDNVHSNIGSPGSGGVAIFRLDNNSQNATTLENNILSNIGTTTPFAGCQGATGVCAEITSLPANVTANLCPAAHSGCTVISSNPQYVGGSGANALKLQASSPANNQGLNLSGPFQQSTTPTQTGCGSGGRLWPSGCTDYASVQRPPSGAWEIGAFEIPGVVGNPPVLTVNTVASPTTAATCVPALPAPAGTATLSCTINGTGNNSITISGTSDTTLTSASWSCGTTGRCTGDGSATTAWATTAITLLPGQNTVTFTGTNANGSTAVIVNITFGPTFPGNTLVLALGMEDLSSGLTSDSSGNKNNASVTGAACAGTAAQVNNGRYGKAFLFDGSTQCLTVPDANSLDLTQSFTISAWVNPTLQTNVWRAILIKNAYPQNAPYMMYASTTGVCNNQMPIGSVTTDGALNNNVIACYNPTPLPINTWTFMAVTYDGTTLSLWRSDINQLSAPVATAPRIGSQYMEASSGTLQIGSSSPYNEWFQGLIDEVRVYNFALPRISSNNNTLGAVCNRSEETAIGTASIVGDANCSIVALTPPLNLKVNASATGMKVNSNATGLKLGNH